MITQPSVSPELEAMLEHWVSAGIVTNEQADRIRADSAATTAPAAPGRSRATSLVTEAMGYLGGVIVLVGLGLATGWFWSDLSTPARVTLAAVVAVLLSGAGAVVPTSLGEIGIRLRSVLWASAAFALFSCLALLGGQGFGWDGNDVMFFAGGGTTVAAAVLWAIHRHVLQEAAVLTSLLVSVAAMTTLLSDHVLAEMTSVWAVGVLWFTLSAFSVLQPRRTGMVLGAIAAIVASMTLESEGWGTAIAMLTVVTLVAVAVGVRDLTLLAVASLGMLAVLPPVIVRYFPGMLTAALALVVVGLLLVAAAVYTARRRRPLTIPAHR